MTKKTPDLRALTDLVDQVATLDKAVQKVARATPATNTAIDGGRGIQVLGDDGEVLMRVAANGDGTATVQYPSGPVPATPDAPVVKGASGAAWVQYTGLYSGAPTPPADFAHVEVHVAPAGGVVSDDPDSPVEDDAQDDGADFTPGAGTLAGVITAREGGAMTVALDAGVWWVRLVVRTLAGQESAPSASVLVDVAAIIDDPAVAEAMAQLDTNLATAGEDIAAAQERLTQTEADLVAADARIDAVGQEVAQTGAELSTRLDAAKGDIADAEAALDNLATVRLPGIDTAIENARAEVDTKLGKVQADMLLIGPGELVPDPYFDGGGTYWNATTQVSTAAGMPGHKQGMAKSSNATGSSNMSIYFPSLRSGKLIPVVPGEVYEGYAWVYSTDGLTGLANVANSDYAGVNLQIYGYAENTTANGETGTRPLIGPTGSVSPTFPKGQWVKVGGQFTVPANTNYISPILTVYFPATAQAFTGQVYVGHISIRKAVGSTLIENGAVKAQQVDAQSVGAAVGDFIKLRVSQLVGDNATLDVAAVNQLFAGIFASNKITTDLLQVGSMANLYPDDNLQTPQGGAVRWAPDGGTGSAEVVDPTDAARRVVKAVPRGAAAANMACYFGQLRPEYMIPVNPGETYRITYEVMPGSSVSTGTTGMRVYCYTSRTGTNNNQASGTTNLNGLPVGVWTTVGGLFTIPDGIHYITPRPTIYFANNVASPSLEPWYMRPPKVVRAADAVLITDGSVTAPKITASEELSAKVGQFLELDVSKLVALSGTIDEAVINKLWLGILAVRDLIADAINGRVITGTTIQTDADDATGIKMSPAGLEVWSPEGDKTLSITAGRGVDFVGIWGSEDATVADDGSIVYPTGVAPEQVATIDYQGTIAGKSLSVEDGGSLNGAVLFNGDPLDPSALGVSYPGEFGPVVNGRALVGANIQGHVDVHPGATDRTAWLDAMPLGSVARAYRNMASVSTTNGETEILELNYNNVSSRAYKITVLPWSVYATGTSTYGYLKIYRKVGARPTMTDADLMLTKAVRNQSGVSMMMDMGGVFYDLSSVGGNVYYLFTFEASAGTLTVFGSAANGGGFRALVEDMGLISDDRGTDRTGFRSNGSTPPAPKPTEPPKPPPEQQYTTTVASNWYGTYWVGNGNGLNSGISGVKVAQGRPPGVGYNMRGLIGFPSVTATLSGATVKKVEVYVYASHWYSSAGGVLSIGTHGATSKPSTYATNSGIVQTQKLAKPEGRWVTLPSSVWAGIKSGTIRGIQIYDTSTAASHYGYLDGSKSKLRITYTK